MTIDTIFNPGDECFVLAGNAVQSATIVHISVDLSHTSLGAPYIEHKFHVMLKEDGETQNIYSNQNIARTKAELLAKL